MMSAQLKEAHEKASEIDKTIGLSEFNGLVQVIHEEGTTLIWHNATVRKWKDWYMVFPEHHRIAVYHKDDVLVYYFTDRKPIPEALLDEA